MPKRSKAELDILITIAAGLFAIQTPRRERPSMGDAKEIAVPKLNTSERSAEHPSVGGNAQKWEEVLQTLKL